MCPLSFSDLRYMHNITPTSSSSNWRNEFFGMKIANNHLCRQLKLTTTTTTTTTTTGMGPPKDTPPEPGQDTSESVSPPKEEPSFVINLDQDSGDDPPSPDAGDSPKGDDEREGEEEEKEEEEHESDHEQELDGDSTSSSLRVEDQGLKATSSDKPPAGAEGDEPKVTRWRTKQDKKASLRQKRRRTKISQTKRVKSP